jgi:dTDP-glucose 4,6-dehydratase
MQVFITGGAGFIGSEFARSALNGSLKEFNIEPTELIVYDSLTYAGNMQNLDILQNNNNFRFIHGNICDQNLNQHVPYECDLVINFAAESHVDRSLSNASIFIETNVLGTQNVLEVVKEKKVKKFIQVSTDEVYGSITNGSWDENFPLSPNSPYAASKASADLIALSYYKTYKLPLMITRCSNNYGPYQNIEKLIPLFISNLIEGKKVPLYGNGKNIREWIHVSDHVRGIAFAYKYGNDGEIYNIAGDTELTNIDITQAILQNFNFDNSKIEYVADRKGHDFRYSLNDKKIRLLGFKNKIKFEEGLKETISWYQDNQDWYRS